jgi:purine-cytosine permease-like protein
MDAVKAGRRDEWMVDWKDHEAAAGLVVWLAAWNVGEMAGGLAHAKVLVLDCQLAELLNGSLVFLLVAEWVVRWVNLMFDR